jgi:serine-aspartate repeat-containing protein C/D/E
MSAPRVWLRVSCGLALTFVWYLPPTVQAKADRNTTRPVMRLVSEPRELPPLMVPPFVPPVNEPLVDANIPALARPWVQSQLFSGGTSLEATWHLSVINGGSPRATTSPSAPPVSYSQARSAPTWPNAAVNQGAWALRDLESVQGSTVASTLGMAGAIPVCGDFNGDGRTELGVFVAGVWYLDTNGNGRWDEQDLWVRLGAAGDQPVTGDWDGDGKTDIGIFGRAWRGDAAALASEPGLSDAENATHGVRKNAPPSLASLGNWRLMQNTSTGSVRADAIDHVFQFGSTGDRVIVGDWSGDGIDTIGVFRHGHWVLDVDGDGRFTSRDTTFDLGGSNAVPVAGDFNGDGIDEVGVFEQGVWRLDTNGDRVLDERDRVVRFGQSGDLPLVGDFSGNGQDGLAVFHAGERLTQAGR